MDAEARDIGGTRLHGIVNQVSDATIEIESRGRDAGEILRLPFVASAIHPAEPGEYTITDTQEILTNPDLIGTWTLEQTTSGGLRRWVQVLVGGLLTPLLLFCSAGAVTIFAIPKVQASLALLSLAALILLGCLWALQLCVRLVRGLKPGQELFGPWALRIIAATMMGLVLAAVLNGYLVQKPVVGGVMAVAYILGARRLWRMALLRRCRQSSG